MSVALIENYKPKAKFHPGTDMSWDRILGKGRDTDLEGLKKIPILELDTFHILGIDRWLAQFIRDHNHEGSLNYLKLLVSTSMFNHFAMNSSLSRWLRGRRQGNSKE